MRDQVAALRALDGVEVELYEFAPGARALAARAPARRCAARYGGASASTSCTPTSASPPGRRSRCRARVRALTVHGTDLRHPRTRLATRAALPRDRPARRRLGARSPRELPGARARAARAGAALRRRPRALPPARRARRRARELGLEPERAATCCSPPTRRAPRSATTARSRSRAAPASSCCALGGVEPERVPLWVNAANAVLVPSEREGFGLAVLEALACDVPVLATPVGIHAEALAGVDGHALRAVRARRAGARRSRRTCARAGPARARAARAPSASRRSAMAERVAAAWRAALERSGSALGSMGRPWIRHPPRLQPTRPRSRRTTAGRPTPARRRPRRPIGQPGFGARGRMRRRARFLRKARELAYRDLGGLVFNLHRFGQRNDALVLAKLAHARPHRRRAARARRQPCAERQPVTVLREAGITACPRCAAIHGSEDRFCPNCGLPMSRHADLPIAGAPARAGRRAAPRRRRAAAPAPRRAGAAASRRRRPPRRPPRRAPAAAPPPPSRRARPGSRAARARPRPAPAPPAHAAPQLRPRPRRARRRRRAAGDAHRRRRGAGEDDQPTEIIRPPARRLVSVAAAPPTARAAPARPTPRRLADRARRATAGEACPLCGAPLAPSRSGACAAAPPRARAWPRRPTGRRRSPRSRVVAALALGVLAAALVKLAGGSGPRDGAGHARR